MIGTSPSRDIIGKLADPKDSRPISEIFDQIREAFGADHAVYHALNVRGLTREGPFLQLTYDEDWIAQYFKEDYFNVDPVVEEGKRAFMPFNWSDLDWRGRRRRDFADDANGHTVGSNGISVPIRGPDGQHALFSLATSRPGASWDRQMIEHLTELHIIAHHVHQAAIRANGVSIPVETVNLSTRERETLQWAAEGKTSDDIGEILGIAERTVRVYLDTSRHKLNATNRTHAVARALSLGLIHPPS